MTMCVRVYVCVFVCVCDCAVVNRASVRGASGGGGGGGGGGGSLTGCFFTRPHDVSRPNLTSSLRVNTEAHVQHVPRCVCVCVCVCVGHTPTHTHTQNCQ